MEKLRGTIPVLYSFRRCPYAMRARLAIAISAITVELREVLLRDKPAALLCASPKGTVPLLTLDDVVIDQSLDIMRWALRRRDPEGWLTDEDGCEKSAEMITKCDENFKFHLDRYKYSTRFPMDDPLVHRQLASRFLMEFNDRLGDAPFLGGERRILADVAIAPFVRQFAQTDPEWFAAQPWQRLSSWLSHFDEWSLFHAVMKKYAPWHPGDAAVFMTLDQ
jgi:glutathione S-transferase